jgi:hypothetical protein
MRVLFLLQLADDTDVTHTLSGKASLSCSSARSTLRSTRTLLSKHTFNGSGAGAPLLALLQPAYARQRAHAQVFKLSDSQQLCASKCSVFKCCVCLVIFKEEHISFNHTPRDCCCGATALTRERWP